MKLLDKLRSLRKGRTQKEPLRVLPELKVMYVRNGQCVAFNVYVDGTEDARGTQLNGIQKVCLPKLYREDRVPPEWRILEGLQPATLLRIDFDCPENAAVLLKEPEKEHRIEVRAAVQLSEKTGGYVFHGYRYVMDAKLMSLQQNEIGSAQQMTTSAYFRVGRYKLIMNGDFLWDAGT